MASNELIKYNVFIFRKLKENDPQGFNTEKKKCLSLLKKEKTLSSSNWKLLKFLDEKEYTIRQQYDTSYKYNDINYFKSLKKEEQAEFSRQSYKCIMDLLNAEKLSQSQWQVLKFLSAKSYDKKRYMVSMLAYEEESPIYFEAFKYLKFDEELKYNNKENAIICKAMEENKYLDGIQDRMCFYSKIFCHYSISALLKYAYKQSNKNKEKLKSVISWACEQLYKDVSCCQCLNITGRISYVLPLLGTPDNISYFFTTNWIKLVAEDETTSCNKDFFFLLFVVCLLFPHFFEYKKFKNIFIGSECLIEFLRNYNEQSFNKNKDFFIDVMFRIRTTRDLPSPKDDALFSIFKENVNQLLSEHPIKEVDKESENKKATSLIGNNDIHITTENKENVENVTEPTLSVTEITQHIKNISDRTTNIKREFLRNTINYEERQQINSQRGNKGEEIVLEYERKRLKEQFVDSSIIDKVRRVSLESDDYGYDILSFSSDGKPRYIEVKSTSKEPGNFTFFYSANELSTAKRLGNEYTIIAVFNVDSENPIVWDMGNPFIDTDKLKVRLTPIQYKVDVEVNCI